MIHRSCSLAGELLCFCSGILLVAAPIRAATIVVTSTADVVADDGSCTLREAVTASNDHLASGAASGECAAGDDGSDTIAFSLGTGTPRIDLDTVLPFLNEPAVVDGGTGGATRIEVHHAGVDAGNGFTIAGGSSTLRSLVVDGFDGHGVALLSDGNHVENCWIGVDAAGTTKAANTGDGILIAAGSANTVGGLTAGSGNVISGNGGRGVEISGNATANVLQGNRIGTDAAGSAALGNTGIGVLVFGASNVIGGTTAAAGNVISGNGQTGVRIDGAGATGNLIQGNRLGTDAAGAVDLGNAMDGVLVSYSASGTVVGGTASGAGNLISGNEWRGVAVSEGATGTLIRGNLIGTNAAGVAALGNALDGVGIFASGNTVGGAVAGAGNVISGNGPPNGGSGVYLDPSGTDTVVQGNRIGTNAAGTAALPNVFNGVQIRSSGNQIGGTAAGAGNLVSGNLTAGVFLTAGASGNLVQGNRIGTVADGTTALANGRDGITLGSTAANGGPASNNTIGGLAAGAGNVIAFNGRDGIRVAHASSTGNALLSNAIFSNATLGIDLGGAGVTANDGGTPPDGDSGPNGYQNFPVVTGATATGASIAIAGTLGSAAATAFTLQFFANPTCDGTNGEGRTLLGTVATTTDVAGGATIDVELPAVFPAGWVLTATATSAANDTSEFSTCFTPTVASTTTTTTIEATTTTTTSTSTTTTTSTTSTTSTATSSTTTTVTTISSTTTTVPPPAEICGNCVDDDGDGFTDFEDPACCASGRGLLALRKATVRPKKTGIALLLKARLPIGGTPTPSSQDLFLQLRAADGTPSLCARIPAARFKAGKRRWVFRDRTHAEAGARGVDRVVVVAPRSGPAAITLAGKAVSLALPPAGVVHVTVAFHDETKAICQAVAQPFRALGRTGGLKVP